MAEHQSMISSTCMFHIFIFLNNVLLIVQHFVYLYKIFNFIYEKGINNITKIHTDAL